MTFRDAVGLAELGGLLDRVPGIRLLTIDFFDTLVTRRVASPRDVFYDAQQSPAWQRIGLTAPLRIKAECEVRAMRSVEYGDSEVTLEEIYRFACKYLSDRVLDAMDAEIESELRFLDYVPEVVRLVEEASRRGIGIVIVSDTYLTLEHFERLLRRFDVPLVDAWSINEPELSGERRKNKVSGLLGDVLERRGVVPHEALHIGDSPERDFRPACQAGMHAALLVPQPIVHAARERVAVSVGTVIDPGIRHTKPAHQPFRRALAHPPSDDSPEGQIGYSTIGPIVTAFAGWLCKQQYGADWRWLMRDSWLFRQAYGSLFGHGREAPGRVAWVSRLTATRAGMTTHERLVRELARRESVSSTARRINMPELAGIGDRRDFEKVVLLRESEVFERASQFAVRLGAHLRIDPERDVKLIDVGYEGTAVRMLRGVISDRIRGHYLLGTPSVGSDDWSLVGNTSELDPRAVLALTRHIAPLEICCAAPGGSVIDYEPDGTPIFEPLGVTSDQQERVARIQASALEFAERCRDLDWDQVPEEALRQVVVGALGRLLYAPGREELEVLERFELEINLGTGAKRRLVDVEETRRDLIRRGTFALANRAGRLAQGAELRGVSLDRSLAWLTIARHEMELSHDELAFRRIRVPVAIEWSGHGSRDLTPTVDVEATATSEGFFALEFPLVREGSGPEHSLTALVLLGRHLLTAQIEGAYLIDPKRFYTREESSGSRLVEVKPVGGVRIRTGGIKFPATQDGIAVSGPAGCYVRIVFRPLEGRPI